MSSGTESKNQICRCNMQILKHCLVMVQASGPFICIYASTTCIINEIQRTNWLPGCLFATKWNFQFHETKDEKLNDYLSSMTSNNIFHETALWTNKGNKRILKHDVLLHHDHKKSGRVLIRFCIQIISSRTYTKYHLQSFQLCQKSQIILLSQLLASLQRATKLISGIFIIRKIV